MVACSVDHTLLARTMHASKNRDAGPDRGTGAQK
jgi:hypothetical protein